MSKIFGYKQEDGKNWYDISGAYSDGEIELVRDPEGGAVTTLPTAIPSPFARMDLVKTAFQNISKTPELKAYKEKNGNVVASQYDEKLVSYCLDLAEILFNYDNLRDRIQIIVWDKDTDLQNNNDQDKGHRRFLGTLKLYLEQDAAAYNFDSLKRLYLIQYNYAIIGCTSPVTLFFTTANEERLPKIRLTNDYETFSDNYKPLYERDPEFQKYLHLLFASNPILVQRLQSVHEYLRKSLERTPNMLRQEIQNLINNQPQENLNRYAELDTGTAGSFVEVLGVPLRKRRAEDMVSAVEKSDFIIRAAKKIPTPKPLVLQNNFNRNFTYINGNWDRNTTVPYFDDQPLDQRTLPNSQVRYPYLTVSDFLEPYLIRLVYPINHDKFFNGNLKVEAVNKNKHYLLPLKKEFFNYFKSDDLVNGGNNLPQIEMVQGTAGSVKVTLRIPIQKNNEYITFERIYYDGRQPNEPENEGAVIELQFGVNIFPFIKLNNANLPSFYRVQLIDRNIGNLMNTRCELRFFSNERKVPSVCRNRSRKPDASSHYYVLNEEFDYIQFQNTFAPGVSGIIIPKWRECHLGNTQFHFAVDFGTTNTHIEYKDNVNGTPIPFDIIDKDVQIATLFHPTETSEDFGGTGAIAIGELIDYEFVPQRIGRDAEYKFPQRTVIAERNQLNVNDKDNSALADFNIPFVYEKKRERDRIHSNLKWSEMNKESQQRIKAYFEEIMMLLRNKVLLNGGNLAATRLVWFYPSSMTQGRLAYLEELWTNLFHHYFGANNPERIYSISESLAPFYYYKGAGRIEGGAATPAVSIDIGGGTTDVVIFQGDAPRYLTSFEFAANAIFGNPYGQHLGKDHGLVRKYLPQYQMLLTENRLEELNQIVKSIIGTNKSDDINSFLFSIERHPRVNNRDLFSYNRKLSQDEDFKIVFLYFYTAIVYHIAELMQHKGVAFPKEFIFSGNGSRILNIITPNMRLLKNLSKKIFEKVYEQNYPYNELGIEIDGERPKEVTCKGGLTVENNQLNVNLEEIKTVFTCLNGVEQISYQDLNLNQKRANELISYVKKFNEFFLNLAQEFNFRNNFNVSPRSMDEFREHINNESIPDNLARGLKYNRQVNQLADNDIISETLFFFPLTGSISALLKRLADLNNQAGN